jgi:MFS family permease
VILRVHALGLGVSGVLLGYVLYNVSYAGLSYPAGAVSDRVPRHLVFTGGMGVFAAAYTGLGVVTTPSWVWLLLPLYGGFAALTDGRRQKLFSLACRVARYVVHGKLSEIEFRSALMDAAKPLPESTTSTLNAACFLLSAAAA